MRLTERDIQMLRKLHQCYWLSTSQIKRYFFANTSRRAINKRLFILMTAQYIFAKRLSRMTECYYRLGARGKTVLMERLDMSDDDITIPLKLPVQLKHFSTINDIRWYFERDIEKRDGAIDFFLMDRELKGMLSDSNIIPDALIGFRLNQNQLTQLYAIEYDAGTENPQYFGRDKVKKYYAALESKHRLFMDVEPQVLVYADTRNRVASLIKHSMRFLSSELQFWFCALADIPQAEGILSAIYLNPVAGLSGNRLMQSPF